jgi:hypothetical protein
VQVLISLTENCLSLAASFLTTFYIIAAIASLLTRLPCSLQVFGVVAKYHYA